MRTARRGSSIAFLAAVVPFMFVGTGCGPNACVGGIGVCKHTRLASVYVVIDPSGSQAHRVKRQAADVQTIARTGHAEITIVRLRERPAASTIVTRVELPKIDTSDPNAFAKRTALLEELDGVVRRALAHRTNASDHWGALDLVRDDARQRGIGSGYRVYVLGDSEPCVPGVCWTREVPTPKKAVAQVRNAYAALSYRGEKVTFVMGGDGGSGHKPPAYVAHLKAAVLAVCKSAGADSCKATTEVAS
nr:VWA-like domain (DUF2201) [uncultured bacterium]